MIISNDIRTTITLPNDLMYELKKKALLGRKTLKDVIIEGLGLYLYAGSKSDARGINEEFDITSLFGAWGKGPSGKASVKTMRYGKVEKKRETFLRKEWKKS